MPQEAKHTPGPWVVIHPEAHHGWYVEDGLGRTVCDLYYLNGKTGSPVRHDPHGLGEDAANARLIAAAPELLAFVARIARYDPVFAKGVDKVNIAHARALVAKVEVPAALAKATEGQAHG